MLASSGQDRGSSSNETPANGSQGRHARRSATALYIALAIASLAAWLPTFVGLWYLMDAMAPASEDENQFGPYGAGLWGSFLLFTLFIPMAVNFLLIALIPGYRDIKPWCFYVPLWPTMALASLILFDVRHPGPLIGFGLLATMAVQIGSGIWWQRRKERRTQRLVTPPG